MKTHSSLDELTLLTNYDPSQQVKGTLVVTGYLPLHRKGRVEFLYDIPDGLHPVDFQRLLHKNQITSDQLFSMFCAGWAKESTFQTFRSTGIEFDVEMFGPADKQGNHCLQVEVGAIDPSGVTFFFKLKAGTAVTLKVKKKEVVETVYRVVPHYYVDTMVERKKAMVKNAPVAGSAVYVAKDGTLSEKLRESISRDLYFPQSLRAIMGYEPETKEIKEFKNRLGHLIEDEKTAEIKQKLRAEVDARLPEFEKKTKQLLDKKKAIDKLGEETKNQSHSSALVNAVNEEILSKESDERYNALLLEIEAHLNLGKTYPKHAMLQALLSLPYMNCIKDYAVAYLIFEHVLPMLYDERELNADQTLYLMVRDWMHSIQLRYLMIDFDRNEFDQYEKFYKPSVDAIAVMQHNAYEEKYYTAEHLKEIVKDFLPIVNIHESFRGTSYHENLIYFSEDLDLSRVKISLDCGFMIIMDLNDFYLGLRKEKITLAYTELLKGTEEIPLKSEDDDEESADFSVFVKNPNESFVRMMNPLNDDEKLIKPITCKEVYPHVQPVSALSVEEKISLLVSLWIIECRFYSEDWGAFFTLDFNVKKAAFVKKVDSFLALNSIEIDPKNFFKRDALLAQIAFYIAKNLAYRVPSIAETSKRLTLEMRVELIKAIYHGGSPFGNSNYLTSPKALEDYVKQLQMTSITLIGQNYMQEYWSMARPYLPYVEADSTLGKLAGLVIHPSNDPDVKELTELTDFMMALNNASFLDTYSTLYEQNTNNFVLLRKRRECLLELMFHILILNIDPIASKKFATANEASYAHSAVNLLNSSVAGVGLNGLSITKYETSKVEKFKRELTKIDELLGVKHTSEKAKKIHKHTPKIENDPQSSRSNVGMNSGRDHDEKDDQDPSALALQTTTTVSTTATSAEPDFLPQLKKLEASIHNLDPFFNSRSKLVKQGSSSSIAMVTDKVTTANWIDEISIRYTSLLLKHNMLHSSQEAKNEFIREFKLLSGVVISTQKFIKTHEEDFKMFMGISLGTESLFRAVDDCLANSFELQPYMNFIRERNNKASSTSGSSLFVMYQRMMPIMPFGSNDMPDDKAVYTAMLGSKDFSVLKQIAEVRALIKAIEDQDKPEYQEAKLRLEAQIVRIEVREELVKLRDAKNPEQIAGYIKGILQKTADAETDNPHIKQTFAAYALLLNEFKTYLGSYDHHHKFINELKAIWKAEEAKVTSSSSQAVYLPHQGSLVQGAEPHTPTSTLVKKPGDF
jgi:hypothetical protein